MTLSILICGYTTNDLLSIEEFLARFTSYWEYINWDYSLVLLSGIHFLLISYQAAGALQENFFKHLFVSSKMLHVLYFLLLIFSLCRPDPPFLLSSSLEYLLDSLSWEMFISKALMLKMLWKSGSQRISRLVMERVWEYLRRKPAAEP